MTQRLVCYKGQMNVYLGLSFLSVCVANSLNNFNGCIMFFDQLEISGAIGKHLAHHVAHHDEYLTTIIAWATDFVVRTKLV